MDSKWSQLDVHLGIEWIRCSECQREVDEFVAIRERWTYWSDGCGNLMPFCAECAERQFGHKRA